MRYRVLGPLDVRDSDQQPVAVRAAKLRLLLSVLLLRAGRPTPAGELFDTLWPVTPPRSPHGVLRTYVSEVRQILDTRGRVGDPTLSHGPGGYRLDVPAGELDLLVFGRVADEGMRAVAHGDLSVAAVRLPAALAMWRGRVLEGVPLDGPVLAIARELEERRLAVQEAWADTRLALGGSAGLVGDLRVLYTEHPTRERLAWLLMRALDASGQRAEALSVYAQTRRYLRDELGVEPGADLQRLHRDVLAGTATTAQVRSPAGGTADPTAPRQLPPAIRHFTGRTAEITELTGLCERVSIVDGPAGVGKTALAVHWAWQHTRRFPDGQLYVNLRGFDPTGTPVTPGEALCGFLDALGVPPQRIPSGLDARAALYRSLLAGRRVLVVLDNARDTDQVRPLLPGSTTAQVLVTSRNRLVGLVAREGAHPVTLDLLGPDDAGELLANHLGTDRTTTDPRAVADIVAHCAGLPLALTIVASRAAAHPTFPLAALADELRSAQNRLDPFDTGEPSTHIRAAFSWSYRQLGDAAARLFRLLGLHPAPDVSVPAAATLAGFTTRQVRPLLAELVRAHLVEEHAPGRYSVHDLLRAYATEQAVGF